MYFRIPDLPIESPIEYPHVPLVAPAEAWTEARLRALRSVELWYGNETFLETIYPLSRRDRNWQMMTVTYPAECECCQITLHPGTPLLACYEDGAWHFLHPCIELCLCTRHALKQSEFNRLVWHFENPKPPTSLRATFDKSLRQLESDVCRLALPAPRAPYPIEQPVIVYDPAQDYTAAYGLVDEFLGDFEGVDRAYWIHFPAADEFAVIAETDLRPVALVVA